MVAAAVTTPFLLTDPGFLFIAPVGSAVPANTVAGSIFTDTWPVAWLPLGATEGGSEFSYTTAVQPVKVEEFFDPIQYRTTDRSGHFAFNLASYTLTNYRRALNGGVAALTPVSGTGATALYNISPPAPGTETRAMIGWESLDSTVRIVAYQTIQGGEVKSAFKRAPAFAQIPCTFNFEVPAGGKPWDQWSAGANRG